MGKDSLCKDKVTATAKGIMEKNATEKHMILCNLLDFIVSLTFCLKLLVRKQGYTEEGLVEEVRLSPALEK